VGWFQGRTEFGPRALGNRSILACPTFTWMKDFLNLKVKHREPFRPFAACVLLEEASKYFENVSESPFMLKVYYLRQEFREIFPAIRHVDGSCRLQTVTPNQNPELYRLLVEMRRRTGFGVLLNTSMNLAGEPIIDSPDQALNLFDRSGLEALVLGPYIISKHQSRLSVPDVSRSRTVTPLPHRKASDVPFPY